MSSHDQKPQRDAPPGAIDAARLDVQSSDGPCTRASMKLPHELPSSQTAQERQNEALQRTQIDLEQSRDRFIDFFEVSPVGYLSISDQGVVADINLTGASLLGFPREHILDQYFSGFVAPESTDIWRQHLAELLQQQKNLDCELILPRTNGTYRQVRLDSLPLIKSGLGLAARIVLTDITERKQAEEDRRIAAIAFESQEGIAITNSDQVILRVNKAFSQITGYPAEEVVGQTPRLLSSGRHDGAFYAAMWEAIAVHGSWQGEIWNRRKCGEVYPEWLTITAVKNDKAHTSHYVAAFTDISLRKTAENQINHLAFYDPLTGLPNRRLLMDRLEQALVKSARHGRHGALMLLDLDNFKIINDTLGHAVGDQLLIEVTARLRASVREGDTLARLGGDEFVVVLENLDHSGMAALQAESVAHKILSQLSVPFQLDRAPREMGSSLRSHHCTSSLGISLFKDNTITLDELLKRADTAMYQAKAAGRNTLRFYDPQMQAEVTARATMEADLREAILKNQFLLYYQAQVMGSDHLVGVEALLCWQHPQRGRVLPAEFIPMAEETGLILPLGRWVLETACTQLALWASDPGSAHLDISVNVSARQFHQSDFVEQVTDVLDQTGADPHRLKLELTETLLVADIARVIARMNALKKKGVSFSLDDFGTGYSSLAHLKRLPLDQLKIDQSFVTNILTDPNDAAIAKMVIGLADSMGLTVIAEGVETEGQREFLAQQGCHAYQGYLFSRPLPIHLFERYRAKTGAFTKPRT